MEGTVCCSTSGQCCGAISQVDEQAEERTHHWWEWLRLLVTLGLAGPGTRRLSREEWESKKQTWDRDLSAHNAEDTSSPTNSE